MELGMPPKLCFWLGFILSLICVLNCGLDIAFNVYALTLKETFNFTQTQVEVIASSATMGMALNFLEPICTRMFGFKVTCLIIVIGVPISSGLFSLAAHYNQFFRSWPSLIGFIQLVLGTINCNGYLAFTRVFMEMFPAHYTGKLLALYMAVTCCGKIYFGVVMDIVVSNDLAGFFLSVSVVSLVCYSAGVVFLYPLSTDKELQGKLGKKTQDENSNTTADDSVLSSATDMLKSPFFHIMFWGSAINYACGYTYLNNITAIAQSVGVTDPIITVFLMSCVIIVVRLSFGVIIDRYMSVACGFALLFTSYSVSIAGLVVCMFYLDQRLMLAATVLLGMGLAPGMSISSTVLFMQFGRSHYSAISGTFYGVTGAVQVVLQVIVGFLYDSEVSRRGEVGTTCYGRHCFYWSSWIMMVITVTVYVLQIVNFVIFAPRKKTKV